MPQSDAAGVSPTTRALSRTMRHAIWLALFAVALVAAPVSQAQTASVAPMLIELDANARATPEGSALADAQDRFRSVLAEDPGSALALAKEVVSLAIAAFGNDDPRVGLALTNLAIVQADTRDYATAIENYTAAITSLELSTGTAAAPELELPLRGLADAYMATGAVEAAIPLYERAILVTHVNDGPSNLDQIPTAASLSRAWLLLGKNRRATTIQESIYRLQQRNMDESSDGYVDALMQRAQWYEGVRDFYAAAKSYRRAAQTLATHYDPMDARRIEPLIAFAFSAPQSATSPYSGVDRGGRNLTFIILEARRAVDEAVKIARAQTDEHPHVLPMTLVAQGDWAMLLGNRTLAWRAYREAWAFLDADPSLHRLRDELFAEPTLLTSVRFDRVYSSGLFPATDDEDYPQRGFVEINYNVSVGGAPVNLEIVDSEPAGLLDGQVYRGMPSFVFRPAFRDGRAVKFTGMTYRHQFRYNGNRFTERERDFVKRTRAQRALAKGIRGDSGAG
ncbi:MAG: tetratricopeptide repeat protein [Pseudomonadota bacterium]